MNRTQLLKLKPRPFSIIASTLLAIVLLVASVPLPVSTSSETSVAYTYDAFGNLLAQSATTENNYLYTGEQYDPNVGFYYLRARYYDMGVGRFITTDPWGGSSFDPPSLHKYLYAGSDPVNNWDPSGEFGFTLAGMTVNIGIRSFLNMKGLMLFANVLGTALDVFELAKKQSVANFSLLFIGLVDPTGLSGTFRAGGKFGKYPVQYWDEITDLSKISYTRSTKEFGQAIHKLYRADELLKDVRIKEYDKIKGIRIDFIDFDKKIVYEFKPYNKRSIREGLQQLDNYVKEVERIKGPGWKGVLDVY